MQKQIGTLTKPSFRWCGIFR